MSETDDLALAPFDASDYLDSEETIAEYLRAALENPVPDASLSAVRDVAKARASGHARSVPAAASPEALTIREVPSCNCPFQTKLSPARD